MKRKLVSALIILFSITFATFVVYLSENLSNSKKLLLKSSNIVDVTNDISTKIQIKDNLSSINGNWIQFDYSDSDWKSIKIPSYQIVKEHNFKIGNYAYYRIFVPKKSFVKLNNLNNEIEIALQYVFFSELDVWVNGKFFKKIKPKNSIEAMVIIPVKESADNLICLRGTINTGDTGIDHRDKILLGRGAELNALHNLSYKAQTVFQLIFILCKGSILFVFALIFLLLRVESSFEKFFIFGVCSVLEEFIAGEYFLGPLNFNQMVYLYNFVNFVEVVAMFTFFLDLLEMKSPRMIIVLVFSIVFLFSTLLTIDALHFNFFVNLSSFMRFWNLVFLGGMMFFAPRVLMKDKILFCFLIVSMFLYAWGAFFSSNIGLNLKVYGNLLLFIMVAYQTFNLFRRDQDQLLEQEKDVAIGKVANLLIHDVRKPLDQIRLVFDKLTSNQYNDKFIAVAKNDLEIAFNVANKQINEVLNLNRSLSVSLSEVSFYNVLSQAIKQVMVLHQEMQIELEYDFKNETKIWGEESSLNVMLVNLISNAVEAIRDIGGRYNGKITFSTMNNDGYLIFKILNDGPHIPKAHLIEIFKPFKTFGKSNGTGLGLASVSKILAEHEGTIDVENVYNGVEFTVKLRALSVADDYSCVFKSNSNLYNYSTTPDAIGLRNKIKIFVFDLPHLQSFDLSLKELKKTFKVDVVFSSSASEALAILSKNRFDFYFVNDNVLASSDLNSKLAYLGEDVFYLSQELSSNIIDVCINILSNRRLILFVDDSKLFRLSWQMFHGDCNIVCASSPEEGISLLKSSPDLFDTIVLDNYFTNSSLNGIDVARRIKCDYPNKLILICSSADEEISEFVFIKKNDYDVGRFHKNLGG